MLADSTGPIKTQLDKPSETRSTGFGVPHFGGFHAAPPKGGTPNRNSRHVLRAFPGILGLVALIGTSAFGQGSEAIIKQHAKDLRDQNNARQGVAPPSQPANAPSPSSPPAAQLSAQTPQQQAFARLQTDLVAIKGDSTVSPAQTQQIAQDLLAAAQGAGKPSSRSAAKLASDLAAAVAEKNQSPHNLGRLMQDLSALFNNASLSASQTQAVIADVQAIFQKSGTSAAKAAAIADDLKTARAEIQKGEAK
jgi:hypothetical protein